MSYEYEDFKAQYEEDLGRMRNESVKTRRTKRRMTVAEIRMDTFKRICKTILPITLAAGIAMGGVGGAVVNNTIDSIHHHSYYSDQIDEFRTNYVAPNTHRTQDNENYWYDYDKIAQGIESAQNKDEAIFICYLTLDSYQTGKVIQCLGYENFTSYITNLGFNDVEEYEKYMYNMINKRNDINKEKKELNEMLDDHTFEYDFETNTVNLGGK